MILASNSVKACRVAVVPSKFTSNIAEFGNPMFRLESLNPKEDDGEKLPEGYTRVGWIAGAGDALLNTGYYPNHNSEILIDRSGLMDYAFGMFGYGSAQYGSSVEGYTVTGAVSYGAMAVCTFGALSSDTAESAMFPIPSEDVGWDTDSSGGENPFEGYESEIAETRFSIYMSKDELRVGAVSVPNPATLASIDPWDIPFALFGSITAYGSDVMAEPMPDMIFSFKVSENGVPVVNMLPCIEDATGQPGFYDTVRKGFITGEGMFFTGDISEPEPLPTNLYIFNNCTHYSQVGEIYPSYIRKINDWNYYLSNLQIGGDENGSMFAKTNLPNITLKSFSVNLPALTDGSSMFDGCRGLTSFTGNLPNLTDGSYMFCYTSLASWDIELPNLTDGSYMFDDTSLASWDIELPNLTNGTYMFYSCTGLTSFTGDLPALTDGTNMFSSCTGLTSWDIELPNLTNGTEMFYSCTGLTSFTGDLPALTNGINMFWNCTGLTSWDIELPNLTNGASMFRGCTGLTSFTGDLPALTNGRYMFGYGNSDCTKLDLASVQHIANTINNLASAGKTGYLYLGMDASLQDTEDLETALAAIRAKGWTVTELYRS